jgi:hypothetical protein
MGRDDDAAAADMYGAVGVKRPDPLVDRQPPPGQMPVVMAALYNGLVLMAVQLWLLTVALELFMSGAGHRAWDLTAASGVIFLGGLLVLWLLRARPGNPPRIGPTA